MSKVQITIGPAVISPEPYKIMTGARMTPRNVDLTEWLDGIGLHPPNTERKQLGHEAARKLVGQLGTELHHILPPGRDKSLVFTALEDVLMRANRALALGDGPDYGVTVGSLRGVLTDGSLGDAIIPEDPRIEQYKAEQRGETPPGGSTWSLEAVAEPGRVSISTVCHDPGMIADVCREFLAGRNADQHGPFRGFVVEVDDLGALNNILRAIAVAGNRAFEAAE